MPTQGTCQLSFADRAPSRWVVSHAARRFFSWWVSLCHSPPVPTPLQQQSLHRAEVQHTGTVLTPPLLFQILEEPTSTREELFCPRCPPQLWSPKVETDLIATAQLWTSPDISNPTAHCNSIPTSSRWIGTALEEESCMHFSEACCHEKILES